MIPSRYMRLSFAMIVLFCVNGTSLAADPNTVVFELAAPIANPENFNPFTRDARRDGGAHQAMWEPLFIFDQSTGKLEGWLAQSLTTSDQKEWLLRLRTDVKWSDGQGFDADDVVFTAKLVIDHFSQLPSADARTFAQNFTLLTPTQTAKVEKVDAFTVRFILKEANPRFALENFGAGLFSSFMIMPEHRWAKARTDEGPPADFEFKSPIGTGPYKLEELPAGTDASKEVRWELDPNWWGVAKDKNGNPVFRPAPLPEHLVWKYFGTENDSIAAFKNNELDAPVAYSPEGFADVKQAKQGSTAEWDSAVAWNDPCARQLDVNIEHKVDGAYGPWTNATLRQALSLLIDRSVLARDGYGGTTKASSTMFADYGAMRVFIDEVEKANLGVAATAEIAAGKQLLVGLGYTIGPDKKFTKDGKVLTATITVNEQIAGDLEAVRNLETQLETAGVDVVVHGVSKAKYWGQVIPKGEYEIAYGWLACGSIAEPFTSMSRYLADRAVDIGKRTLDNTGRWRSGAATSYSTTVKDIGTRALDDAALPGLVVQAYAELAKDMPIIPLVQSPRLFAFNTSHWTGWPSAQACTTPVAAGAHATCTVPMHDWAGTHRLLFNLQKAPQP